jgi:FtsH-binding integral membrane protein
MIDVNHPNGPFAAAAKPQVDLGLRAFLQTVLAKVALGLLLAAAIAYVLTTAPACRDLLFHVRTVDGHAAVTPTGLGLLAALSPLMMLLLFSETTQTRLQSALLYWSVAAAMGASSAVILVIYTGASIATTFAAAAAGFGALCLYGYTTNRDLTAAGAFFGAGLISVVAALGLNLLLGSPAIAFAVNLAGAVVFAGLIAWDMQRLKLIYHHACENTVDAEVASNTGALCLFLDFANLYQLLLMAFGQRR